MSLVLDNRDDISPDIIPIEIVPFVSKHMWNDICEMTKVTAVGYIHLVVTILYE